MKKKKIKKNILYHESMRIKFTFELSSFFKLLPTTIGDELWMTEFVFSLLLSAIIWWWWMSLFMVFTFDGIESFDLTTNRWLLFGAKRSVWITFVISFDEGVSLINCDSSFDDTIDRFTDPLVELNWLTIKWSTSCKPMGNACTVDNSGHRFTKDDDGNNKSRAIIITLNIGARNWKNSSKTVGLSFANR